MTPETVAGWVLPGLVDAHCHIGLGAHGAVDDADERAAGAGRPRRRRAAAARRRLAGRHPVGRRPRGPAAAGPRRSAHRPADARYIRNFAHEIEPEQLADHVAVEARRGDGWVKLVGDWIDRGSRRSHPLLAAVGAGRGDGRGPRERGPGDRSLLRRGLPARPGRGRHRLHRARHAGSPRRRSHCWPTAACRVVPTLVNIATFPSIADAGEERYPAYAASHAGAAPPPLRHGRAPPGRPACRSSSAPTPAVRSRTGWWRPRWPSWSRPA